MSLQTAPLGQLSGLNLPYSIPTYEKPRSILQQALAAALVGVATNAGKSLGDNLTARDYATEADGGPAKGFSRLLGPKVDARANEQRQARAHDMETQEKGQQFTAAQNEYSRAHDTNQSFFDREARQGLEKQRQEAELAQNDRQSALANARQMQETQARQTEMETQYKLQSALQAGQNFDRNNSPESLADARYKNAEAARIESFLNRMASSAATGGQPQVPGQPQVDPTILADEAAMAPRPVEALPAGMTPEQAIEMLRSTIAPPQVNAGAATVVEPDPESQLQAILQALGVSQQQPTPLTGQRTF